MKTAFIGMGSNIDAFSSISEGIDALVKSLDVTGISKFYFNEAVGSSEGQGAFLNGVIRVQTDLSARELKFDVLRKIEHDFGRRDGEHKHDARRLDLDLILYGSEVIDEADLKLPHPEILTRDFVFVPIFDLVPGLIHPAFGVSLSELVNEEAREMKSYSFSRSIMMSDSSR